VVICKDFSLLSLLLGHFIVEWLTMQVRMSAAGRGLATAVGLGAILITYRLTGVDQMAQVFKKKELKDKYDYVIGNSLVHYSVLTTQRRIRFLVAGDKQGRRVTAPKELRKN